ncbi:succinyl-diaminopimelate desuccinylase [Beggiatoa alba B18LD]|uniref:Succinyl-diaminopimelate desuccinylase n=1 Tax=Beggiatoa alba B18LD TaxID=395493 RepID=I3CJH1_9GAMM|nr:succinyl-diaminopimelate desuccinylase [Beggiatoa alba]EIJ43764.1 succinyl-diaminopimelate desuccinylase [Beggiatoa alba B18LD]
MSDTLDLAINLISRPSVTPTDAGCQDVMIARLQALDFTIEPLRFGDVDNFWARRGKAQPLLVFAGHTDVVPTGSLNAWRFPPFIPTIHNGLLYGRGAADMKGGLAAMLTACERFVQKNQKHKGSIGFLITSDEEGPSVDGTVKVVEHLKQRDELIDWCIIGEPSSIKQVGDMVKNGRRGSLNGKLIVKGVQGHVAYPHLANNPIHHFSQALQTLCSTEWDNGNAFFPPTTFQISNIHAGTGAENVIPAELEVMFNFRYSTEVTADILKARVQAVLDQYGLNYEITWRLSGLPFLTEPAELVSATQSAIEEVCGYPTELSTSGGTSDGRFIATMGTQVVELGVINQTIHKVDECVSIAELDRLSAIYERILEKLLR